MYSYLIDFFFCCCIGDILLETLPDLQIYVDYVNNYDNSNQTYCQLQKNSEWVAWNQSVQQKVNSNLDLPSFLITPVQRIPRYELLLRELLKLTAENHKDYECLLKAKEGVVQLNKFINDKQKEQQNVIKLQEIQDVIIATVPIVVKRPNRLYVFDGDIKYTLGTDTEVEGHLYVLNDIVLLARVKHKKQQKKKSIRYEYIDTYKCQTAAVQDTGNLQFNLVDGNKGWITFTCKTPQEKKKVDLYFK